MDIGPSLIAHGEAAKAVQPGERALDDPAMTTQALAGVDPLASDPDPDVPTAQRRAAARDVVALVGMQLPWALAAAPIGLPEGRDGIEQCLEDDGVVAVGPGQERSERDAIPVSHKMALRARFAAIRRVRTDGFAPLLAGMLALSREARLQSMRSASPSRSSSSRWSRSQTPASCQSRNLRQHVTPEPQPSSGGSISQGMPDFSTKMMPVRAARSGTRGRPPLGLGGSAGSSGATSAHNSSLTRGLLMAKVYHASTRF
jgi:hypothetical protein